MSNSSTTYAAPLVLEPGRSRILLLILGAIHLAAAAVLLFTTDLAPSLRLMGAAFLVLHGLRQVRLHALRDARCALTRAVWEADGLWRLRDRQGREMQASLLPGAFVHPWLHILVLRPEGAGRLVLLLAPDSVNAEDARRLRVRLRLSSV